MSGAKLWHVGRFALIEMLVVIEIDFGAPAPSHQVTYDPQGMQHYQKRLKLLIGWDLLRPGLADNQTAKNSIYSGKQHLLYFSLHNPDTRKH